MTREQIDGLPRFEFRDVPFSYEGLQRLELDSDGEWCRYDDVLALCDGEEALRAKVDAESSLAWLEGQWKDDYPQYAADSDLQAALGSTAADIRKLLEALNITKGEP